MRSSARNQFRGRIKTITPGVVNTEVELDIGADQSLIAIITAESAAKLQLAENARVVALIKASSVIISTDTSIKTSARNKLVGTVSRLVPGAVNSEVVIDIGGDKSVCAMITDTSFRELGLQEGQPACALFKAPSIILLKE